MGTTTADLPTRAESPKTTTIHDAAASRPRVVHITSAHAIDDVRIFGKECRSLAMRNYDITLLGRGANTVATGLVKISALPLAPRSGRVDRFLHSCFAMTWRAYRLKADIYHFHDPDLLPMGFFLKLIGRRVIYDVHEDLPRDTMLKDWLPSVVRRPVAYMMRVAEAFGGLVSDGIVAATPTIADRFPAKKTALVRNFPRLAEFTGACGTLCADRPAKVVYVGLLEHSRGLNDMVKAAALLRSICDQTLVLAGRFEHHREEMKSFATDGWSSVDYRGWLDRARIAQVLAEVRAGLVVLHRTPTFVDSYPIKMFEYMAAGLPVIASDFPVFREILGGGTCGLLVEPGDPQALAEAIRWIFENPVAAAEMGRRGRDRVTSLYAWETEEAKLVALYQRLLRSVVTAPD